MDIGVFVNIGTGDRVRHHFGLLGRGAVVEIGERLSTDGPRQDRKIAADRLDIVAGKNRIADGVVTLWLLDCIQHVALASSKSPVPACRECLEALVTLVAALAHRARNARFGKTRCSAPAVASWLQDGSGTAQVSLIAHLNVLQSVRTTELPQFPPNFREFGGRDISRCAKSPFAGMTTAIGIAVFAACTTYDGHLRKAGASGSGPGPEEGMPILLAVLKPPQEPRW